MDNYQIKHKIYNNYINLSLYNDDILIHSWNCYVSNITGELYEINYKNLIHYSISSYRILTIYSDIYAIMYYIHDNLFISLQIYNIKTNKIQIIHTSFRYIESILISTNIIIYGFYDNMIHIAQIYDFYGNILSTFYYEPVILDIPNKYKNLLPFTVSNDNMLYCKIDNDYIKYYNLSEQLEYINPLILEELISEHINGFRY